MLSTWPFQRQIITNAKDMMRHELWPWTIEKVHLEKVTMKKKKGSAEDSRRYHPFVRHIVAVGDLHGDLLNARRVLEFSGVTDEFGDWSGEVDFFVQTGDIIDRCAEHSLDNSFYNRIRFIIIIIEETILYICLIGWIDFVRKHYALAVLYSQT